MTPLLPSVRDDFAVSIATAVIVVIGLARLAADLPGLPATHVGPRRLSILAIALLVAGVAGLALNADRVEVLIGARIRQWHRCRESSPP